MSSETHQVPMSSESHAVIPGRTRQVVADKNLSPGAIREGIPKELFEQSTAKSMYYLARDLVQVFVAYFLFSTLGCPLIEIVGAALGGEDQIAAKIFKFAMWNVYWLVQGLNFTALWVLAHECGHGGFSPSRAVNDAVGLVVHSFLLVPYHSWRLSHGTHHKNTNHTEMDTVFVPEKVEPDADRMHAIREAVSESPIVSLGYMFLTFTLGWPLYLTMNMTGQKYSERANHFEPTSPLFRNSEGHFIVQSDLGLLGVIAFALALVYTDVVTGSDILCWYFIPYMWNNCWLVFITYLQHSDVRLPHYNAEEWTFVRGALCTIDRSFGAPLNWWLHHINDSHIVHHLFSTMPFYNAIIVTEKYLYKTVAKEHCLSDDRSLWTMVWESWRNCLVISTEEGVCWMKNK